MTIGRDKKCSKCTETYEYTTQMRCTNQVIFFTKGKKIIEFTAATYECVVSEMQAHTLSNTLLEHVDKITECGGTLLPFLAAARLASYPKKRLNNKNLIEI